MALDIQAHCKKQGIRFEYQGPDLQVFAPKGKKFGNDSTTRVIEDFEYMSDKELEWIISV